jgi:carbon storage regulator
MLILTRRQGESLRIGEQIVVSVLSIKGNQVRIGISAPRSIAVYREELYARIADEAARQAGMAEEISREHNLHTH